MSPASLTDRRAPLFRSWTISRKPFAQFLSFVHRGMRILVAPGWCPGSCFLVGTKTQKLLVNSFWNFTFLATWGCPSDFLKMLPKFKMAASNIYQQSDIAECCEREQINHFYSSSHCKFPYLVNSKHYIDIVFDLKHSNHDLKLVSICSEMPLQAVTCFIHYIWNAAQNVIQMNLWCGPWRVMW